MKKVNPKKIKLSILTAKSNGIDPNSENWISRTYKNMRMENILSYEEFKKEYLSLMPLTAKKDNKNEIPQVTNRERKVKKSQPSSNKKDSKKQKDSQVKETNKGKNTSFLNLKKELINLDLKIDIKKVTNIYEMFSDLLLNNPKIKKITLKKIQTFFNDENLELINNVPKEDLESILFIAKTFYSHYKSTLNEDLIGDKEFLEITKTILLPKQSLKKDIKQSMSFSLDNIKTLQRFKLLSREQEYMYARMVRDGTSDEERKRGREKLTEANLRLVISIARKYNFKGIPLQDLIDEGQIGLQTAIDRFDPSLNNRFSTYATWWIMQSITKVVSKFGKTVRIPQHHIEDMQSLSKEERNMALRRGDDPSEDEVNERLKEKYNVNIDKLNIAKKSALTPLNFDKTIGDKEGNKFADYISDETISRPNEMYFSEELSAVIEEMMKTELNDREREIVGRYHGFYGYEKLANWTKLSRLLDTKPNTIKSTYIKAFKKLQVKAMEKPGLFVKE